MVKLIEIITKKLHLLKDTSKYNVYVKGDQIFNNRNKGSKRLL